MNIFSQVQTGDIFVLRWSYGQTNVGFFQVMRAAAQTVVIRRLNSHFTKKPKFKSNEGSVTARAGDFDTSTSPDVFGAGQPVRKKLSSVNGRPALKFSMGRYCPMAVKWGGKPVKETWGY